MAVIENAGEILIESLGGTVGKILLGVGIVVMAPVAVPFLRPVTKEIIKGGISLTHQAQSFVADAGDRWSDLFAEAKAELTAASTGIEETPIEVVAATTGRKAK